MRIWSMQWTRFVRVSNICSWWIVRAGTKSKHDLPTLCAGDAGQMGRDRTKPAAHARGYRRYHCQQQPPWVVFSCYARNNSGDLPFYLLFFGKYLFWPRPLLFNMNTQEISHWLAPFLHIFLEIGRNMHIENKRAEAELLKMTKASPSIPNSASFLVLVHRVNW